MEIEINFRLDENGRTVNTKQKDNDSGNSASTPNENDRTEQSMDYSTHVAMTNFRFSEDDNDQEKDDDHQQWIDDILFDCEISDSGLMPRTFWMPAKGMKPRCTLEQFALNIFHHHVPKNLDYDYDTSGAEWWCQIRPSPEKTGRYSMHCQNNDQQEENDQKNDDDPFTNGISMHVDKDEELRILTGGTTYIHPHLSTVTYLTGIGSPTMIMNCRVHPLAGTWIVPDERVEGFVSWPAVGKHTSFDGRFLHAAPCDLMEEGAFEKQVEFQISHDDEKLNKIKKRRHRRVTFLVNIWLNYRPFDVRPFPDTMIDKMSGRDDSSRIPLVFITCSQSAKQLNVLKAMVTSSADEENNVKENHFCTSSSDTHQFTWPLGDNSSEENLQAHIPLNWVRKVAPEGGNVKIIWQIAKEAGKDNCFHLLDVKTTQTNGKHGNDEISNKSLSDKQTTYRDVDGDNGETSKRLRVD